MTRLVGRRGLDQPEVLGVVVLGFAAAFGFAGLAAVGSAAVAAGLALAWRTAGFASGLFASGLAPASAAAAGFFAPRARLPCFAVASWLAVSAATAATRAAPLRVGPV